MEQETVTVETWSPKRGAFLAWMAGSAAAALVGIFLLVSLTLHAGRTELPFEVLLDHQRAKLAGDLGSVVFVGDSSLGNAVNAQLFSQLSGSKATNLALTAGYGYQGTLQMIEAVLKHRHPSDFVIVQTPEMMMRRPDPANFDLAPLSTLDPIARFRRIWLDTMNLDQLEEALREHPEGQRRRISLVCRDIGPETRKGLANGLITAALCHPLEQTSTQLVQTMLDAIKQVNRGVVLQRTIPFEIVTPESL